MFRKSAPPASPPDPLSANDLRYREVIVSEPLKRKEIL